MQLATCCHTAACTAFKHDRLKSNAVAAACCLARHCYCRLHSGTVSLYHGSLIHSANALVKVGFLHITGTAIVLLVKRQSSTSVKLLQEQGHTSMLQCLENCIIGCCRPCCHVRVAFHCYVLQCCMTKLWHRLQSNATDKKRRCGVVTLAAQTGAHCPSAAIWCEGYSAHLMQ